MSVLAPTKSIQSKVHNSEYIRTEDKPAEGATTPPQPSEPAKPESE